MAALYILIPIAVVIVGLAIWLFFWAVDSGQFEDLDSPAHSILFDDDDPRHQAGMEHAKVEPTDAEQPAESGDERRG